MIHRNRNRSSNSGEPVRIANIAAGLMLAAWLTAAPGWTAETAVQFIRDLGNTAIRELAPNDISPAQREAKFRELLQANFDLPRITRFVLGRYARRVSGTELKEFESLYEDIAVLTYAQMFASYSGHIFTVNKQLGAPGDKYVMVVSELKEANGAPAARLDWQVLVAKSSYSVVDIRVEGVSMAIAQRDEYTAFLDKNGGDMSALLKQLKTAVDNLRDGRDSTKK